MEFSCCATLIFLLLLVVATIAVGASYLNSKSNAAAQVSLSLMWMMNLGVCLLALLFSDSEHGKTMIQAFQPPKNDHISFYSRE